MSSGRSAGSFPEQRLVIEPSQRGVYGKEDAQFIFLFSLHLSVNLAE